jgi:hypothetical protein
VKLFVRKGYHIGALNVPAKLVYTLFLVFVGAGLWTSWAIYEARIGASLSGPPGTPSVEERYVNRPAPALPAVPAGGPELDLGPELELEPGPAAEPPAMAEPPIEDLKGPWVLDVFHQHLFSVSVVFLILGHLFMLAGMHPGPSGTIIVLAGLSGLLHVLAPVIIWKTGGWLWLMPATGATMGITWTLMVVWTLFAMWFGGRGARAARAAQQAA